MIDSIRLKHNRSRVMSDRSMRRGAVLPFAAALLVLVFCFAAFAIDIAMIALTKAQLQNTADASAIAAANALEKYRKHPDIYVSADRAAGDAAIKVTSYNKSLGTDTTLFDDRTDLKLGSRVYDKTAGQWVLTWGVAPFNMVQVQLDRSKDRGNPLTLAFANIVQQKEADIAVYATAALMPATGFYTPDNGPLPILPITVDIDTWAELEAGLYPDNIKVDQFGVLSNGSDKNSEVAIFPNNPNRKLPSGNRGTLALGGSENSTEKLSRQIREGLNAEDLEFHGGTLSVKDGPLYLEGDPGISAGIEDDLKSIIGQPRIIPIFTEVNNPGGTSIFKIVKFVGIRVLEVDLRGSVRNKKVVIQPSQIVVGDAERGTMQVDPSDKGVVYASDPALINAPLAPQ